jgi:diguanylate cyclase (GGDEF)-like protein
MDSRASGRDPERLLAAQMNELSLRERVSAAVAVPAILTVAWVHWGAVPPANLAGWTIYMCLVQALRVGLSNRQLRNHPDYAELRSWRAVRVLGDALNGAGWGGIWFVLDSGRLDFLFMFKFGALCAALGVTVNALSVVLRVYIGFVVPAMALMSAYLVTGAEFLQPDQRLSIFLGVIVYTALLVIAARSTERLSRLAFEQGFEREAALAESQASHQREVTLRERLQDESRRLAAANERLLVLARQDVLTGTFNRRHLVEELEREMQALRRYYSGFSIISFDIDHFKAINDNFGHQIGDAVLKGLTQLVQDGLREIDVFGRWGGEEFLCILPNTPFDEALLCAERLRRQLSVARLVGTHPELVVTASFGVASCQPDEGVDSLIGRVDAALYDAKAAGRNQVKGASTPT